MTAREPWAQCLNRRILNWLLPREAAWATRKALRELRKGRIEAAARKVHIQRTGGTT